MLLVRLAALIATVPLFTAGVAAKSPPDGHTMVLSNIGLAINETLYPKRAYDVMRDLAPVSLVGITPNAFVVHPSLPTNTMKEFLVFARAARRAHLCVTTTRRGMGFSPAQTPKHVVARLNAPVTKALAVPDVREKLGQGGVEPEASTPEAFGKLVHDDIEKWRKIIRVANIKAE